MLIPAVALLLAASACGSGDDAAAAAAADEVATTVTTAASSTTSPPPVDPKDSDYCVLSRTAEEADAEFVDFDDPTALEVYLTEQAEFLRQAMLVAPPELSADLAVMETQVIEVTARTIAADYEFSALVSAVVDTETEEVEAASDALNVYDETVCGITAPVSESDSTDSDSASDDGSKTPELTVESFELARASESGRAQMVEGVMKNPEITEQQAGCFIDEVSPELFVALGNDAEQNDEQLVEVIVLLETCEIPLSAMS